MESKQNVDLLEVRLGVAEEILNQYVLGEDDGFDPRNITRGKWNTENPQNLQCFMYAHYWVGNDLREAKLDFHVKFDEHGSVVHACAYATAGAKEGKSVGKRRDDYGPYDPKEQAKDILTGYVSSHPEFEEKLMDAKAWRLAASIELNGRGLSLVKAMSPETLSAIVSGELDMPAIYESARASKASN